MKNTTIIDPILEIDLETSIYEVSAEAAEKQRIIKEKKAASAEKASEQEAWRRIVVKVISWSDGLHSGGIIKQTDTITPKEWKTYVDKYKKINVNNDKHKVEQDLEDTKQKIASFGGFTIK